MAIQPKFPLGQVVVTPGALQTFSETFLQMCLGRHVTGDWGDVVSEADKQANDRDVKAGHGFQILSVYEHKGKRLWIATEGLGSDCVTTLHLPEEH